jgi:hypothetical protein
MPTVSRVISKLPAAGSPNFRTLFRYRKDGRTRTYGLRPLDADTVELWVVSEQAGKVAKSRRLVTIESTGDADPFLQEIERELRAGGWAEV